MAITIYKYAYHVTWDNTGVSVSRISGGTGSIAADLSNYYTKIQLGTPGLAEVDFANIMNAYHNDMLGLQGGDDNSSGDSSEYLGDFYHLSAYDYYLITAIPEVSQYFGTDGSGVKGWYAVPEGGDLFWEADSLGDLSPITAGAGIYVDGLFIKNYIIDAQDGSQKHLTVTAGDASGSSNTAAGNLYLKAGNSIVSGNSSTPGKIYLIPGNDGSTGSHQLHIQLGQANTNAELYIIDVEGTAANIGVGINSKGAGNIILASPSGYIELQANQYLLVNTPIIYFASSNGIIKPSESYNSVGGNITLSGGQALGNAGSLDGGNLYLKGGIPYSGGTIGKIYVGTGSAGTNPLAEADSAIAHVLMYDTATGEVTFGDGEGGGPGGDSLWELDSYPRLKPIDAYELIIGTLVISDSAILLIRNDSGPGYSLGLSGGNSSTDIGGNVFVQGGYSEVAKGGDVFIMAGGSGNSSSVIGGDVFIIPGFTQDSSVFSDFGNIYLGGNGIEGLQGMLPLAESTDHYIVNYDPDTGKLSYTDIEGVLLADALWEVDSLDILQPVDPGSISYVYFKGFLFGATQMTTDPGSQLSIRAKGAAIDGNGGWVELFAGTALGSEGVGGDLYLGVGTGDAGNGSFYLHAGEGPGLLPAESTDNYVVHYDPITGKLSYDEYSIDSWWYEWVYPGSGILRPYGSQIVIGIEGDEGSLPLLNITNQSIFMITKTTYGDSLGISAGFAPYSGGHLSLSGGIANQTNGGGPDGVPGNIYIYPGSTQGIGTPTFGNIYFGNDSLGGMLYEKTSETTVVYYDPTTGLLSYGYADADWSGNPGGVSYWENVSDILSMVTDEGLTGVDFNQPVTLSGSGILRKRLRISILETLIIGTGTSPEFSNMGLFPASFYTIGDSSAFSFTVPDDWQVGTNMNVSLSYAIDEDNSSDGTFIRWSYAYACCSFSEDMVNPTHSGDGSTSDMIIPEDAGFMENFPIVDIPGADISDFDLISVVFMRDTLSGAGDNPTAEPGIVSIDVWYSSNRLGGENA